MNTLVLTWTISPSTKVLWKSKKQLDTIVREKEYFDAIYYYLAESDFDTIIFCDNSDYDFQYKEILLKIAKDQWKKLELLKFKWNPIYPEKYWYGAWEQEIMDYVFDNSKYIHRNKTWFKITWRHIITNINDTIKKLSWQDIYFQKQWIRARQLWVSTAFFKVSNEFYKKYIYINILKVFDDIFTSNIFNIEKFTKYPYVSLEYIYYFVLRKYLTKEYCTKMYIANKYLRQSVLHYSIYRSVVTTGFSDFTKFNNVIDILFFNKMYKEIIKLYK